MPLLTGMAIAGIAAAAGGTAVGIGNKRATERANKYNTDAQLSINEQNRQATIANNELARNWAMDDWYRNNAYNSPLQQMQRLKEAGLNPHLIYGSGTATNIAQPVKNTNPETPKLNAPQVSPAQLNLPDYGSILQQFVNVQKVQAENENLKIQKELLEQGKSLNEFKIAGLGLENQQREFKLGQDKKFADVNFLQANARLANTMEATKKVSADIEKTKVETSSIPIRLEIDKAELKLKQATTAAQVEKINVDVMKTMYELSNITPLQKQLLTIQINNMEKQGELLQYDMNLRAQGVNPSDPTYVRMIVQLAAKIAESYGIELK